MYKTFNSYLLFFLVIYQIYKFKKSSWNIWIEEWINWKKLRNAGIQFRFKKKLFKDFYYKKYYLLTKNAFPIERLVQKTLFFY